MINQNGSSSKGESGTAEVLFESQDSKNTEGRTSDDIRLLKVKGYMWTSLGQPI